jgi:hypothetical protein
MKRAVLILAVAMMLVGMLAAPALAALMTTVEVSGAGSATVYGPVTTELAPGDEDWGVGKSAVETWKHGSWPMLSAYTSAWISDSYTSSGPFNVDTWRWFEEELTLPEDAYDILGQVKITANSDNAERLFVNGQEIAPSTGNNAHWGTVSEYYFTPTFGLNSIDFVVWNWGVSGSTASTNPNGLIYAIDAREVTYERLPLVNEGKATGGVKFWVGSTEVQLNFVAMVSKGEAKGNVKYSNSNGVSFWGKVNGYYQDDNGAYIVGEIVKGTTAAGDPYSGFFYVAVQDNGEGDGADPDKVMRVLTRSSPYSPTPNLATLDFPITQGNIQIH